MRASQLSTEDERLAAQRRASREVTQGIERELDKLHELDPWKRAREVGFFVLLYFAGALAVCYSAGTVGLLLGIVGMGISLNALGILIHDGLHGLLARNPKANHLLSFLVGLPLVISATAYRVTHTNHHCELGRRLDYGTYRQHLRKPQLVWIAYLLQLFLGTILYVVFIPPLAFAAATRKDRAWIALEYTVIAICCTLLLLSVPAENLLRYWVYPLFVMSVLTNVRGLGSHALGDAENIYLSSRTIKSSNLVSLLFLNENYHLEHHLFPKVPSYHLAQVHALVWNRLPEALYAKSYGHFLLSFLHAALRGDLRPRDVVYPAELSLPSAASNKRQTTQ